MVEDQGKAVAAFDIEKRRLQMATELESLRADKLEAEVRALKAEVEAAALKAKLAKIQGGDAAAAAATAATPRDIKFALEAEEFKGTPATSSDQFEKLAEGIINDGMGFWRHVKQDEGKWKEFQHHLFRCAKEEKYRN